MASLQLVEPVYEAWREQEKERERQRETDRIKQRERKRGGGRMGVKAVAYGATLP